MSSQRNAGIVGGIQHIQTPAFLGGRSLHPLQRTGQAPHQADYAVRKAPLGPSGFGGNMTAPPMSLASPPVLTPAIAGGIAATRSSVYHV
jgi:hypothetical protein